jgi:hypothetical protein
MIADLRVEFGGGEPARQVRIQDERGNDKQRRGGSNRASHK